MSDATQVDTPATETTTSGETAVFTWTETRVFNRVVIPLSVMSGLLAEHAPGLLTEAINSLMEDNADDGELRPVFAAMAAYAEEGDVEVQEILDASAEY